MRIFVALAVVAVSVALGGCFHHAQQVYTAEVPPPVEAQPYKSLGRNETAWFMLEAS
jgi:hypothetical protein